MAAELPTTNVARRCGVQLKPPALVVVYEVQLGGGATKTKRRVMPVRHFRADSNVNFVAECLHSRHLGDIDGMPLMQTERMLRIIQEHLRGAPLPEALERVDKEFTFPRNCPDLNRIAPEMYRRIKEIMEIDFKKRAVVPGDPGYVYDKRVEFEAPREANDWDSTDDEMDVILKEVCD